MPRKFTLPYITHINNKLENYHMENFILSCCSTVDITKEHLIRKNLHYICFHFELDGQQYDDNFGKSISFEALYAAMKQGADTKTSQLNASEFEEYFEPFLQQGKDILHVCVSSGISGTYNSANIAKRSLEERYPERKIYIADSLGGSSGYGLMMDQLADLRDAGWTIDELYAWIEERRLHLHHWFFSSDLTFFVKGGRISKASGFVGNLLNICPLIDVSAEGKLVPRFKIRTKRKVIEAIVHQMELHAENGLDYNGKCYLSHSLCYEDARAVANLIEARFPKLCGRVEIHNIGTTIGCHSGPGTVAIFFWGSKRM